MARNSLVAMNNMFAAFGEEEKIGYNQLKWNEEEVYMVKLERNRIAVSWGICYRVEGKDFIVTGIIQGSAASNFNDNCDMDQYMCAGDVILEVNGEKDPKVIYNFLSGQLEVEMKMLKAGPRWHISGLVADSMERMDTATDRGLNLELATEEKEAQANPEINASMMHMLAVFLACGIPCGFLCAAFSDMGQGFRVYEALAPYSRNMAGNAFISAAVGTLLLIYIADFTKWHSKVQKLIVIVAIFYAFVAGWFLKTRFYPQMPLCICLFHVPLSLGILRAVPMKNVRRTSFYKTVSICLCLVGIITFVMWNVYMFMGDEGESGWAGKHKWSKAEKLRLVDNAEPIYENYKIKLSLNTNDRRTYFFMDCDPEQKTQMWCHADYCETKVPSVGARGAIENNVRSYGSLGKYCCNTVGSCYPFKSTKSCVQSGDYEYFAVYLNEDQIACCSDQKYTLKDLEEITDRCKKCKTIWWLVWATPGATAGVCFIVAFFAWSTGVKMKDTEANRLEKTLRQFLMFVMGLGFCMWLAVSVSGASMRITGILGALCLMMLLCMCVWLYLEMGQQALASTMRKSKIAKSLVTLAMSDWARALVLICLNIMIPLGLCINILNQQVRVKRGVSRSTSWFTDGGKAIVDAVSNWNWAGILLKINIITMAYYLFCVGVAKFTVVFLSWFNEQLLSVELGVVIIVFFIIGYLMFMCPFIPGIPVYLSSGIVFAARCRDLDTGFGGGVVIAGVLSFVLKLAAVIGQYLIGYFMGKSVRVQKECQVDTVFMKAIQKILEKRGCGMDKVAILVGGPDWPTSVLCGILKLNLIQVLIGTVPVMFVSTPVVLAGAFMVGPDSATEEADSENSIYTTLTPVMFLLSGLCQGMAFLTAVYMTQEVAFKYAEELAQPRKEHEAVAKLTRAEKEYVAAWNETVDWKVLDTANKRMLAASSAGFIMSGIVFVFLDEACFNTIKVNDKIEAPIADGGLDGSAFNVIKAPGAANHILFAIVVLIHLGVVKRFKKAARENWAKKKSEMELLIKRGLVSDADELANIRKENQIVNTEKEIMGKDEGELRKERRASQTKGEDGGIGDTGAGATGRAISNLVADIANAPAAPSGQTFKRLSMTQG